MPMLNAAGDPVSFAFPFARGDDGKVVTVVQGTQDHVMTQVNVVVRYPVGYRQEKPTFGIPWPFGEPAPLDGGAIQEAVEAQVPNCDASYLEYTTGFPFDRTLELDVETP